VHAARQSRPPKAFPVGPAGRPRGRRATVLLAALSVSLTILTLTSTGASASTPCPQTFGSFSVRDSPQACWTPYAIDSPFNRPIPADAPTASDNSEIASHMLSDQYHFQGDSHSFAFLSEGSRPVYWSRATDPLVTIHCTAAWGAGTCQGTNGVIVDNLQIHIPTGAQPEQEWDHHMIVIDQANNAEYDFERAFWTGPDELTVWAASEMPVAGSAATGVGGRGDAASFGLMAGIIRPEELRDGEINHALAISVPCTTGYVWPATGPWGAPCNQLNQAEAGALHLGSLLQLQMSDAQIAATHAPAWQQTVMRAMARYGMYVNDSNGPGDH